MTLTKISKDVSEYIKEDIAAWGYPIKDLRIEVKMLSHEDEVEFIYFASFIYEDKTYNVKGESPSELTDKVFDILDDER